MSSQTLAWGNSLQSIRLCAEAGLMLLRQKWLLTEEHIDTLKKIGLLFKSDEDVCRGG